MKANELNQGQAQNEKSPSPTKQHGEKLQQSVKSGQQQGQSDRGAKQAQQGQDREKLKLREECNPNQAREPVERNDANPSSQKR
jgi:hypothetical protein